MSTRPRSPHPARLRRQAAAHRARRDEGARRQDRDGHRLRRARRAVRRRRRHRRRPRRRLGGDGRARPRLDRAGRRWTRCSCSRARSTRGARRPLVVADMPFGSFQVSDEDAVRNAIRFVKEGGADAVKLEGAGPMVSRVRARSSSAGIPVMGHIGLTPQSATMLGGFKAQGKTAEAARQLARRRARARGRPAASRSCSRRSRRRSRRGSPPRSTIPTIGIGAGPDCDGQVLVYHDLLGLYEGHAPALRQALREPRRARSATRSRPTPPRSAAARSPARSTPTRCRRTSWRRSRGRPSPPASRTAHRRAPPAACPRPDARAPTDSRSARSRRSARRRAGDDFVEELPCPLDHLPVALAAGERLVDLSTANCRDLVHRRPVQFAVVAFPQPRFVVDRDARATEGDRGGLDRPAEIQRVDRGDVPAPGADLLGLGGGRARRATSRASR